MSRKRIFISDIHLGDDARYSDSAPERRARFSPAEHGPRLLNFLEKQVLSAQDDVKDLVLLGDVFDTWVCPFDAVPPTYASIFASTENKPILDCWRSIAASNVNLHYVNGNHDYDLTAAQIQEIIPGIIAPANGYKDDELGLYAEHGHRFTLFNQSYPDVADGLPIGYYITRLAEHLGGYVRGFKDLVGYIDEAIDLILGRDNIFEAIIEGLAERAGADEVMMSEQETISVAEIKTLYANLKYHDQPFKVGQMLANEGDLEKFGDNLSKELGHKVVVFGHTHEGKIDKDSLFVKDRVYVNSGCWSGKEAHCAVVEPGKGGQTAASLLAIDAAGAIVEDESRRLQV
ncbi:MAG: metallophosphoesterase [Deltaproteobacteria bacterium]|jgi:UDP-2,3-diacylglucosamine pyrophosphatase LpxH|nr:metallophosphoesterase [Deltaproteobacteria bacterium]